MDKRGANLIRSAIGRLGEVIDGLGGDIQRVRYFEINTNAHAATILNSLGRAGLMQMEGIITETSPSDPLLRVVSSHKLANTLATTLLFEDLHETSF